MLVTMRMASNFITSRFFEGTILQSSYSQDNVLGGNYKKKAAQDELAEYCKANSLTQPNYALKATTDASSIHTNNDFSSAASSSMSLPQPLGSPFGVGSGGLESVPELDPYHRLSLQLQQSYAASVEQLQKMYTCVVRFSSTELYHPAAGITPQQYRFSTPKGAEFEDANQAREVAARVALQQLKRVANANSNRRAWASVARRSAVSVGVV